MNSSYTIIRYVVAYVFITSGIMKIVNEDLSTVFVNLRLPYPLMMMYIVALVELVAGVLIFANRSIKLVVIPLIGIMIAALILTKLPSFHSGFLHFAFNARLDIIMLVLLWMLYKYKPLET